MTATARAYWTRPGRRGEIRTETLPPPHAGEVTVRAICSAISRGTEALVHRGAVPASLHQVMRCPHQAGEFPGPVKYGYMSVGEVIVGDSGLLGRTVFCLHPHQDLYTVPADRVLALPTGLPPTRAVLAANMETAINAVWDGLPSLGDRVSVIGGGVIGCLVAYLCASIRGIELELVDPKPAREATADGLGVPFTTTPVQGDVDVVFHTSGTAAGLATSLALAGTEGTVIELSWYGTGPVAAPLGEAFHARRLALRASQVGALPPARRPRWSHGRRLALALKLLADPALDGLFDGDSPFAELPELMQRLTVGGEDALCRRILYDPAH